MAPPSALPLRFFKDSVYGTAAVLVFALLGRVEKYLMAAHLISFPCLLLARPQPPGALAWQETAFAAACAYASVAAALADSVAVLLLACTFTPCCAAGLDRSPFTLGLAACGGDGWDSQTVAVAAIATLSVGALQSAGRALACARDRRVHLAAASFAAVRAYQLSWALQGAPQLLVVLWTAGALAGLIAAAASAMDLRRTSRAVCVAAAAVEAATMALAVTSALAPSYCAVPLFATQGAAAAFAALTAWRSFGRAPSDAGGGPTKTGSEAAVSLTNNKQARRGLCMKL